MLDGKGGPVAIKIDFYIVPMCIQCIDWVFFLSSKEFVLVLLRDWLIELMIWSKVFQVSVVKFILADQRKEKKEEKRNYKFRKTWAEEAVTIKATQIKLSREDQKETRKNLMSHEGDKIQS